MADLSPIPLANGDGAPHPQRSRVLPGSRWQQHPTSGHGTQTCRVQRVGEHSITFLMEGGGKGGGSHKSGRRFTVPIDAFLQNHTLLAQPKGYQPGDEYLPGRPQTDTLQHYFARRNLARRFVDRVEGDDIRNAVSDLPLDPLPYIPPEERTTPTPPRKEPQESAVTTPQPHSDTHAARHEPVANPVIPPQQAHQVLNRIERLGLANPQRVPMPAPPPHIPPAPPPWKPGPSDPVFLHDEITTPPRFEPTPAPAPEPPEEQDPIEQFMESGRVLVEGLNARIAGAQQTLDDLLQQTQAAQGTVDQLTRQRDRIEAAVLAAISSSGEPPQEEAPPPPPAPEETASWPPPKGWDSATAALRTVTTAGGSPRLYGEKGFVAQPGKKTQREWALDRLAADRRFVVAEQRGALAAEYGLTPDTATKNLSSILAEQLKKPNARWPRITRVGAGVYGCVEPGR